MKFDKRAYSAIAQIKNKSNTGTLSDFSGNMLLNGILPLVEVVAAPKELRDFKPNPKALALHDETDAFFWRRRAPFGGRRGREHLGGKSAYSRGRRALTYHLR